MQQSCNLCHRALLQPLLSTSHRCLNQPISNIQSIELSVCWIVAGYTLSQGAWGSMFPSALTFPLIPSSTRISSSRQINKQCISPSMQSQLLGPRINTWCKNRWPQMRTCFSFHLWWTLAVANWHTLAMVQQLVLKFVILSLIISSLTAVPSKKKQ